MKSGKTLKYKQKSSVNKVNNNLFTGTFNDKWFGDVLISVKNENYGLNQRDLPSLQANYWPTKAIFSL